MALTTAGLIDVGLGQGITAHYAFHYDTSLSTAGLNATNGLMQDAEADFALMQGWFYGANIPFDYPLAVNVNTSTSAGGGASWPDVPPIALLFGSGSFVKIDPGNAQAGSPLSKANFLRFLLVSEVTEMFMMQINNGWYEDGGSFETSDEGSMGEGLSRFLGAQFMLHAGLGNVAPAGFAVVRKWLNSPRQNYVSTTAPDDNTSDAVTGCASAFLWYLNAQLGHSIERITQAGPVENLSSVYEWLTGDSDGWSPFIALINTYYPPGPTYHPAYDNLFPVSDLVSLSAPNEITCGYSKTAKLTIDKPAMAEVNVSLKSNKSNIPVPNLVTIPVGQTSVTFSLNAAKESLPFKSQAVLLTATYAGIQKTATVNIVSPKLSSLTVALNKLTCSNSTTGQVTLDFAPTEGPALVTFSSSDPSVITPPSPVSVAAGNTSATFDIVSQNIVAGSPAKTVTLTAAYGGVKKSLTITVVSPTVSNVSFTPNPVTCGSPCAITITVDQASYDGAIPVTLAWNPPGFVTTPSSFAVPAEDDNIGVYLTAPDTILPFAAFQGTLSVSSTGTTVSDVLTIEPSAKNGVLHMLTFDPPTVVAGQKSIATVTLVNPVGFPTEVGLHTTLESVTGRVPVQLPPPHVPPRVVVPAHQSSHSFTIVTDPFSEPPIRTLTIIASAFGTSIATLQINPI